MLSRQASAHDCVSKPAGWKVRCAVMTKELAGFRVLVVEDEYFLAADLEYELSQAGAEVIGPFGNLGDTLEQVRNDGFELAVLDANLGGGDRAYPVADALIEQRIPFVFASAYQLSEMPERFSHRQLVEKPYEPRALIRALVALTAPTLTRET